MGGLFKFSAIRAKLGCDTGTMELTAFASVRPIDIRVSNGSVCALACDAIVIRAAIHAVTVSERLSVMCLCAICVEICESNDPQFFHGSEKNHLNKERAFGMEFAMLFCVTHIYKEH